MRARRWEKLYARYGPGAVVAGGSEGIGLAVAAKLAQAGFDLVLIARRRDVLTTAARSLEEQFDVTVHTESADLGDGATVDTIADWMVRANAGLLVYNAAVAPVGEFAGMSESRLESVVDVNCRGLLRAVRAVTPHLIERGLEEGVRGGIVLMSSLAGERGAVGVATYAASKSFITTLGESLWAELAERHVDVLTCVAGATDTPSFRAGFSGSRVPFGAMDPRHVAHNALKALGRRPVGIPGLGNRIGAAFIGRILPRRAGIRLLSRYTARDTGNRGE